MALPNLVPDGPLYRHPDDDARSAPPKPPLPMGPPVEPEGGRSASGVALVHPDHLRGLAFIGFVLLVIAISLFFANRLIG